MAALPDLPALTRSYFGRVNQSYGANNTSQIILESTWAWYFAQNLLNLSSAGTASPSHSCHANSVWICRGSGDSTGSTTAVTAKCSTITLPDKEAGAAK